MVFCITDMVKRHTLQKLQACRVEERRASVIPPSVASGSMAPQ
jgi:hypothetical protein